MPRILRASFPDRDTDFAVPDAFVMTRPGVYWCVVAREADGDGTVALTLHPVDGHDIPDGAVFHVLPLATEEPHA